MKKTFNLGKIALYGERKENLVTLEIELKEKDGKSVFSSSAMVWNSKKTDCELGGQCLDDLYKNFISIRNNKVFKKVYKFWKLYHLNDMHAGTIEQEKAIKEWESKGNKYDYTAVCEYLKSINMYEVEYNGKPYKYGHAWLYQAIPEKDLKEIKELF